MLDFKQSVLAVLAFSCSPVIAGTVGSTCGALNATIPCEDTAWDIGVRALYLKPSYSDGHLSYAAVNQEINQYQVYNQNWGWGFFLEGSYHVSTGSDVNLNWYNLSQSKSRVFSGDFNSSGVSDTEINTLYTYPKWDAVNLEFGQQVDFGENRSIRFHGGIQYARIMNKLKLSGTNTSNVHDTLNFTYQSKPTYNGFGARVGADMGYGLGYGLGVYVNGAAALLAGSGKRSNLYTYNDKAPFFTSASKATLVPELEAKLGVKYDYTTALGDLSFDFSWMCVNYFNATQTLPSNFVTATTPHVVTGDFGLQGLDFGLHWLGNGL